MLELPNGRWAAFEIKLGENAADSAASALLHVAGKVDNARHGKPLALCVITGGRFAYQRPDGVAVVPITALGPQRPISTDRHRAAAPERSEASGVIPDPRCDGPLIGSATAPRYR